MDILIGKIATLVEKELEKSKLNTDKKSGEYRLGSNEAYAKVLTLITQTLSESLTNKTK
jgi:hypothetical protein